MECMGPKCASMILEWLRAQADTGQSATQGTLFRSAPYVEDDPAIRSEAELEGALEHLEYAVHRRFENQLTRAERARLDNSIRNASFKINRYLDHLGELRNETSERRWRELRDRIDESRVRVENLRMAARRADLKLAQLTTLTAEGFEEFVAELFEALGYDVDRIGGTGDEGVDLRVTRGGLVGVVQCKYHKKGVVGSPELQKFLGTVHHTRSHKGFFVTTSTFTLSAERFVGEHPIELVDGPRLVELVQEALGPAAKQGTEPTWF